MHHAKTWMIAAAMCAAIPAQAAAPAADAGDIDILNDRWLAVTIACFNALARNEADLVSAIKELAREKQMIEKYAKTVGNLELID